MFVKSLIINFLCLPSLAAELQNHYQICSYSSFLQDWELFLHNQRSYWRPLWEMRHPEPLFRKSDERELLLWPRHRLSVYLQSEQTWGQALHSHQLQEHPDKGWRGCGLSNKLLRPRQGNVQHTTHIIKVVSKFMNLFQMNLTFRTGKGGSVAKDMVLTEKNCTMFKHRFSKVISGHSTFRPKHLWQYTF